jgi:hypothetical protein
MPCSFARALGSILLLLQGLILGVTGRGFWGIALGFRTWAVGTVCGKALAWPRTTVGKACVGAQGRALDAARQKSKGKNCFENTNITRLECGTAPLWERFTIWFSVYWLVRLHGAAYFCFGVAMCEETVIDMFMCQLSHDILIFWTAFGEYCRYYVETSGFSIGSGVTWWPKAEEGVAKRKGMPSLKSVDVRKLWLKM